MKIQTIIFLLILSVFLQCVQEKSGEELAQKYCSSCHLFPEPELANKMSWHGEIMPKMGHFFGIYEYPYAKNTIESGTGGFRLDTAGIYPEEITIELQEWQKMKDFYLDYSPGNLITDTLDVPFDLDLFKVQTIGSRLKPPFTTCVKIDKKHQRIYVGNHREIGGSLGVYDFGGNFLFEYSFPGPVSDVYYRDSCYWVLVPAKRLTFSDDPQGTFWKMKIDSDGIRDTTLILSGLERPVDSEWIDLDQDGMADLVLAEHGNMLGKISIYWGDNSGGFESPQTLLYSPGAVSIQAIDLNQDGKLDLSALFGQGDEALYSFVNKGDRKFSSHQVLRFPPIYGSAFAQRVDIDDDGDLDILYVNGDNSDYSKVSKPYHGIRIYENIGEENFELKTFLFTNGAVKAQLLDYDQDGDRDMVSVSYFADYKASPQEGFIFWENLGDGEYIPKTFPEVNIGRWITLETVDLDGDKDQDLILGSMPGFESVNDASLSIKWYKESPSIVFLINQSH